RGAVLKRIDPLVEAFAAHGLEARLVRSASEEHAKELAAGFAADGARVVGALGGDGMARSVAAGLVDTDTSLGIIAGGRGNDLIGKLGIPKDTEGAVANIAAGRDRIIDVLDFDGNLSLSNVCLGLDSTVQRHANSARLIRGRWVYLYGVLRAILPPKSIELQLTVDGRRVDFRGLTAGFANSGRYGGGLTLSPEASSTTGSSTSSSSRKRSCPDSPSSSSHSCRASTAVTRTSISVVPARSTSTPPTELLRSPSSPTATRSVRPRPPSRSDRPLSLSASPAPGNPEPSASDRPARLPHRVALIGAPPLSAPWPRG